MIFTMDDSNFHEKKPMSLIGCPSRNETAAKSKSTQAS